MIYVALPAHDERHTAGVLVWRLRELFAELGRDFRVLALDDASDDGTADVLEPYDRVAPLTILRNETAPGIRGLARAHRARGAPLLLLPQTGRPPRHAVGLHGRSGERAGARPSLPGRRGHGGGRFARTCPAAPRSTRALRLGARWLARPPGVPEGLTDPWNGFRLYRLVVLRRALADLAEGERLMTEDGWAANLQLLLRVAPHLRQWDEVEVPFDLSRRYRESRFDAWDEMRSLFRVGSSRPGGRASASRPRSPRDRRIAPTRCSPLATPLALAGVIHGGGFAAAAHDARASRADTLDAWRFPVGERIEYSVTWGGARIGKSVMTVEAIDTIAGAPVYRTSLETEGGPPFYRLHDRLTSWIQPDPFATLRFDQRLRQGGYHRDRRHMMDLEALTYTRYDLRDGRFVAER